MSAIEEKVAEHTGRITAIESKINEIRIDMREGEVRREHIDKRFDQLDKNVSRLVWLVITAIVGGIMSFIMNGGLTVVS